MKPITLRLLALLPLLSATLLAQSPPPKHTLRILPLGDPPPYRQEIRDGVRYEVPPADGTIPPRNILVGPVSKEPGASTEANVRLRLGLMSTPLEFPLPDSKSIEAKTEGGANWLRIPLTAGPATLALVWRGGQDWSKARAIALPDGADEHAKGDCRFVNLTAKPMGVTWGNEKIQLNPGRSIIKAMPSGAIAAEVKIQYPGADGSLQSAYSSRIEKKAGRFQQFVIYAADGENPRAPVKVLAVGDVN